MRNQYSYILVGMLSLAVASCVEELDAPALPEEGQTTGVEFSHHCTLSLDAERPDFEANLTRAEALTWNDGDQIYIHSSDAIYGQATYSETFRTWDFWYSGAISDGTCTVYYFPSSVNVNSVSITLSAADAVFADTDARLAYSDRTGELCLSAHLSPQVWRMRFVEMSDYDATLLQDSKLAYPSAYDIKSGTVAYTTSDQTIAPLSDGSSAYLYAAPFDGEAQLSLQTPDGIFSRTLDARKIRAGKSGAIVMPRAEAYEGWEKVERVAKLVNGPKFNERIITLANGRKLEFTEEDNWRNDQKIKSIVFEYQSDKTSATLLSTDDSAFPIYASFEDGTITISTPAEKFELISTYGMFRYCSALTSLNISNFDTRSVTDMSGMFSNCSALTSLNISNFDTSSVTDMAYMFYKCSALTSLNISNFDTRSVTDMGHMFCYCSALTSLNLSNFDTRSVTSMYGMFFLCSALTSLDLSNFDTSSVTDMSGMFQDCSALTSLNISNFDTSSVTNMSGMFEKCSALTSLNLSNFDTSSVTSMSSMFFLCSALTSLNISNFDTSNVTKMTYMLYYCSGLTDLNLGYDFTMENASKSEMCVGLANSSRACTITCIKATKDALSSGTKLNTEYITWNILE